MKKLTQEDINTINTSVSGLEGDNGIFKEPYGFPTTERGKILLYARYNTGGRPGSCYDDEHTINEEWHNEVPLNYLPVLDKALEIINPNISLLEYNKIKAAIKDSEETDWGYYGDFSTYRIFYLPLETLYSLLNL